MFLKNGLELVSRPILHQALKNIILIPKIERYNIYFLSYSSKFVLMWNMTLQSVMGNIRLQSGGLQKWKNYNNFRTINAVKVK